MKKIHDFIKTYHHGIYIVVYMVVYLFFFYLIEHMNIPESAYTILHTGLDDRIPFVKEFVLAYDSWFLFVGLYVCLFVFFDREEYTKLFTVLTVGMTVFLILSALWPNAHDLRPVEQVQAGKGLCYGLLRRLYSADTCTNLVPSIHVYNSVMIVVAVWRSKIVGRNLWVRILTTVWGLFIVLSTMFIKQHSVIDVTSAIVLCIIMYLITYVGGLDFFHLFKTKKVTEED